MMHFQKYALVAIVAAGLLTAACAKKNLSVAQPAAPAPTVTTANVAPAPTPVHAAAPQPTASAAPAQRYPNAATRARIDELLAKIEDAYFDYDKSALRPDAMHALQSDSAELRDILKDYPAYKLTIEGHCDERGSDEYNMALGDKRAESAKDFLVQVGIPAAILSLVSYGKQRPVCDQHDEACWQKNRRIHIVALAAN